MQTTLRSQRPKSQQQQQRAAVLPNQCTARYFVDVLRIPPALLVFRGNPVKVSTLFAGNFIKAADIPEPRVLTIQAVEQAPMPEGDDKPVMRFVGEKQRLVLNKTNALICFDLFGDETNDWGGHQVELYSTTTSFNGRMVPCVRLRAPQSGQSQQQRAVAADADYPVDA